VNMTTKIKICGITNLNDARLAVGLGADLLGFNFYRPSPRYIDPDAANLIINTLPGKQYNVGVFVNSSFAEIRQILSVCPLHAVQLHGDESNELCKQVAGLNVEVIKALRIRQQSDIALLDNYEVSTVLLDAFRAELYGGTGHAFNWNWIKLDGPQKIYLAGGINPDNITEALKVGTYGVDICSGVEKQPGSKDKQKMTVLFDKITKFTTRYTNHD